MTVFHFVRNRVHRVYTYKGDGLFMYKLNEKKKKNVY